MAAGVIQSLGKFRLATGFQDPFLDGTARQETALHDSSEEEEMEEEEEEGEEEEMEEEEEEERRGGKRGPAGAPEGPGPRGKQEATTVAADVNATEMTTQLLRFAERVSDDIQRYFGGKGRVGDPEACNIYEERCSPQLSGRLLYYTDLVRISRSRGPEEEEEEEEEEEDSAPSSKPTWRPLDNGAEAESLGPLAELFEYALCHYAKPPATGDGPQGRRLERKHLHVTPMHGRKLPPSFWREPALSPAVGELGSNPPDFSDLLANWTSETSQEELHAS